MSLYRLLRNWVIVFMANLLGSLCIAWLLSQSGLWHSGANLAGGMTIKLAVGKVTLTFGQAVVLGILCNWLVCLAVWLSFSTTSTAGKILAIYLPIFMFIVSGFEHSVANMYYIPAGILAASDSSYVAQATALGVTPDALAQLGWGSFFINNLLPVSLGNIIGGAVFIGMALMYGNGRPDETLIQAMKEKVLK
ncbi:formate/nitrite transporter family protein [Veillonella ratti]|nr:formate/nitrite transporter family protein [Veillonella ratti]MCB5756732.1 formate/nitrite transporter family protein [Veillonella ratti]MCB5759035.1 formate/nitrite transporter family protein [Veillonella ratti]MCB5761332.1 formate/nitrite transporter family protein [Veillonella ratti]MCB5781709.1 formate/nitrite transporter family protein [Veillonella ratti]